MRKDAYDCGLATTGTESAQANGRRVNDSGTLGEAQARSLSTRMGALVARIVRKLPLRVWARLLPPVPPDEGILRLFVTGCPRTGTTALCELLNADPRVVVTNELGHFRLRTWDDPAFSDRFLELFGRFEVYYREIQTRLFKLKGISLDEMIEHHRCASLTGEQSYHHLLSQLPASVRVVGDKLPIYYLDELDLLLERYPGSRCIVTVRDGRAVIASQMRHHRGDLEPGGWTAAGVEQAEWLWLEQTKRLLGYVGRIDPARVFIVRYEDAVSDPDGMLDRLSRFLGLAPPLSNAGGHYRPVNLQTWRKTHPEIDRRLSPSFVMLLDLLGYH